jgi:hypothetical protein
MEISKTFMSAVNDLMSEGGVSQPIVMASAAGWYIGRVYATTYVEPWDRLSDYLPSEEDAIALFDAKWAIPLMQGLELDHFISRDVVDIFLDVA